MVVFSLTGWSPYLPSGFLVSRRTPDFRSPYSLFHLRDFHPLWSTFPDSSVRFFLDFSRLLTPKIFLSSVWAPPISLATTFGITVVFFSFGYLDVSVPRVPLLVPILFGTGSHDVTRTEFPHSDICGSQDICSSPQLFAACHVLLRRHVPRHPP